MVSLWSPEWGVRTGKEHSKEQVWENVWDSECIRPKYNGVTRNQWRKPSEDPSTRYEALSFNVQALETVGKLKDVNGYVRISIDKLPGIRGDLVRTDENWQGWDFPKFVYALQGWTERNPVTIRSSDKTWYDSNAFNTQLDDARPRDRGCVYCESTDHKPHECTKVSDPNERKKMFLKKTSLL